MSLSKIDDSVSSFVDSSGDVPYEKFSWIIPEDEKIDDKKVEKLFEHVLIDMGIFGERSKMLQSKSLEDKKRFIELQKTLNHQLPSPEYIIKRIRAYHFITSSNKKPLSEIIRILAAQIQSSCISWTNEFIEKNGQLVLFSLLSKYSGILNGFDSFCSEDAEILEFTLKAIHSLCMVRPEVLYAISTIIPFLARSLYPHMEQCTIYSIELITLFFKDTRKTRAERNFHLIFSELENLKISYIGWDAIHFYLKRIDSFDMKERISTSILTFINALYSLNEYPGLIEKLKLSLSSSGIFDDIKTIYNSSNQKDFQNKYPAIPIPNH